MMGGSRYGLYVGKLFGIRFYLHYTWFPMAAVIAAMLAITQFPLNLPGRPHALYFAMGFVATIVFFVSILLHELGHSLVSQRCGIPVPRITLLFIGGIAEISREPDTARAELKIALAGPAVSVALAILYATGAWLAYRLDWSAVSLVLQWLVFVNLSLVIFNAIPGYPLDGGRVLRAIIWARTGKLRKATYITARIGVAFSWVLITLGVVMLFKGWVNAFVLLMIGIFLKNAAEAGYTNTLQHEVLAGVRVAEIMTRPAVCIPDRMPINLVVDEFFLAMNHVAYPVTGEGGEYRGMLRLETLRELPREKWPWTTAGEIAGASNPDASIIDAGQPAEFAMRRLLGPALGRLAVVESGRVTGIITRHDVLAFIAIHTDLDGGKQ